MKLDIIIPHYKEDTQTVMKAVSSIITQVGHKFDVRIIVVTDLGGSIIDENLISSSTDIQIDFMITDEHAGPGYARQYAMDRTSGEYIMFCDSDDQLASPFVFRYFEECLKKDPDLEIIYTAYLEEFLTNDSFIYTLKNNDMSITTLHGKFYQRKFIYDNDVRFTDWMLGEDGAFNFKALCFAKKVIFNDDVVTYIWKYNLNSITRTNTSLNWLPVNIRSFRDSIRMFESFFDVTIHNEKSQVNTKIIKPFIESLEKQLEMIKQIPNMPEEGQVYIQETEANLKAAKERYKDYV